LGEWFRCVPRKQEVDLEPTQNVTCFQALATVAISGLVDTCSTSTGFPRPTNDWEEQVSVAVRHRIEDLGNSSGTRLRLGGLNNVRHQAEAVVSDVTDIEESEPDEDDPTAEEVAQMRLATPEQAAAVDSLVLSQCTGRWRKVAMVVGSVLGEFEAQFPSLPYVYMPIRMLELEERGVLEIAGNPLAMRFSEVRLAQQNDV